MYNVWSRHKIGAKFPNNFIPEKYDTQMFLFLTVWLTYMNKESVPSVFHLTLTSTNIYMLLHTFHCGFWRYCILKFKYQRTEACSKNMKQRMRNRDVVFLMLHTWVVLTLMCPYHVNTWYRAASPSLYQNMYLSSLHRESNWFLEKVQNWCLCSHFLSLSPRFSPTSLVFSSFCYLSTSIFHAFSFLLSLYHDLTPQPYL